MNYENQTSNEPYESKRAVEHVKKKWGDKPCLMCADNQWMIPLNLSRTLALLLPFAVILMGSCTKKKDDSNDRNSAANIEKRKNEIIVSLEDGYSNTRKRVYAAYTNDPDSMWDNEKWKSSIKKKILKKANRYSTILIFDSKENTPNVTKKGMNYPKKYDRYMVCGYWSYPTGLKKFCYGGVKPDGFFEKCEEWR